MYRIVQFVRIPYAPHTMTRGSFTNLLNFRWNDPTLPRQGALPRLPSAPPFGEAPASRFPAILRGAGIAAAPAPDVGLGHAVRRMRA